MATAGYGTPGGVGYVNPFAPTTPNQPSVTPQPGTANTIASPVPSTVITRTTSPVVSSPAAVAQPTPQPAPVTQPTQSQPVNTSLQMTPAEISGGAAGIAAYNARIASQNANLPAPGTTSSTGVTNTTQVVPQTNQGLIDPQNLTPTVPTSFPGIVSSLTQNALAGSPVASAAASGLLASGQSNPLTSGAAYDTYSTAVQNLANFKQQIAKQFGAMETGDEALPVVLGREGALGKMYASQLDALQGAVNQAQQALGYGIQEQGQQQAGLTSAGQLGISGQGQLQSGLTSAAQLVQPNASFPFVFSPTTGTFTAPGVGGNASNSGAPTLTYNPTTDANNLASSVMNKQISYNDALNALSYGSNSSAAAGQLSSAIISKGGNPTNLQAEATGTANTLGSIPAMQSANTAAKGIQQQINSLINSNPSLNAGGNVALINAAQQWLQGKQLTDPTYQTFFNALSEYTNTLAPILGVGGNPTNLKTEIAQSFINPQASGGSIQTVLNNISNLADSKVQNLQSGATGGGVVSTTPFENGSTPSSGSTIQTSYGTINPSL